MQFEVEALLIELSNSNRVIVGLLREQRKLLQEILERLPKPAVYPQTTGLAITVRN
jgi:hypothetical protein